MVIGITLWQVSICKDPNLTRNSNSNLIVSYGVLICSHIIISYSVYKFTYNYSYIQFFITYQILQFLWQTVLGRASNNSWRVFVARICCNMAGGCTWGGFAALVIDFDVRIHLISSRQMGRTLMLEFNSGFLQFRWLVFAASTPAVLFIMTLSGSVRGLSALETSELKVFWFEQF